MAKPDLYVGVFHSGEGSGSQWVNSATTWANFAAKNQSYFQQGLRMVALSSYYDFTLDDSKYVAVWRSGQGAGAQWTIPATDWNSFASWVKQRFNEGQYLVAVTVTNRSGQLAYSGTVRSGSGAQWVNHGAEWAQFAAINAQYVAQGLRLVAVSTTYNVEGKTIYVGVWRTVQGAGQQKLSEAADWSTFSAQAKTNFTQGMRLAAVAVFFKSGAPKYTGVWRSGMGSGAEWVSKAAEWSAFAATATSYFNQGLRLVAVGLCRDQSVPID